MVVGNSVTDFKTEFFISYTACKIYNNRTEMFDFHLGRNRCDL